ncbi:DUF4387 family protein [Phaeacidiphilus oryzae]|uniref:DUF4387 family protein n=1 Tax=Phaeacidiphilus oryzae TaxID=348818 RepID=UPI00068C4C67|nr:DUF4387 family protein [Phaeacidiphilus oryzae]
MAETTGAAETTQTAKPTLDELALEVRSKNAGPFWMTVEAFLPDAEAYRAADRLIDEDLIAGLYRVPRESVRVFRIPELRVVKVSFPRRLAQGSLHDRDIHAGQHHVPLAGMPVPPVGRA